MNEFSFFKNCIKNFKTVGTIARSSKFLCKAMIDQIDFENDQVILELGAGDGVITEYILKNMAPHAVLLSFEINPIFCAKLRQIKDPRLIVIEEDAAFLPAILTRYKIHQVDHVISAIPFVLLPEQVSFNIIQTVFNHMAPDAKFVQMHYSLLAKKLYERIFGSMNIKFVPLNIPPAFLFTMQKSTIKSMALMAR